MTVTDTLEQPGGFDEEQRAKECDEYVQKRERHFMELFCNELKDMPTETDEKRLYAYRYAEKYLQQTIEAIKKNAAYEEIYEEWDKFSFFYDLCINEDSVVLGELDDNDLPDWAEQERIKRLSLCELCEELLAKFMQKETMLASADKNRYIVELFVYYKTSVFAIFDAREEETCNLPLKKK